MSKHTHTVSGTSPAHTGASPVYFCSFGGDAIGSAQLEISLNGGVDWLPAVPAFNASMPFAEFAKGNKDADPPWQWRWQVGVLPGSVITTYLA